MMKLIVAVFVSLVSTSVSTVAWDGYRQGFLLGVGAGTNSQTILDTDPGYPGDVESINLQSAITNSRIGYAFSDKHALLLYGHSLYRNMGETGATYTALNFQYWSTDEPQSNSWFGGIGLIADSYTTTYKDESGSDPDYGVGINFGYGREIVEHVSIETNLTIGSVQIDGDDLLFVGFNTTFNLLGY